MTNQGKVISEKTYLDLLKSLPWPLEIHGAKISFYRNVVRKMSRVNKALEEHFQRTTLSC